MLDQGLVLTFTGMATVFSFLILLVLVISLSSRFILRVASETVEPESERKIPQIEVAVAIAAATARKEGKL